MAVSVNEALALGLVPGGCQTVFVFCACLLEAAASVIGAGGDRFKEDFKADLAFLPRYVGVMTAGPLLSSGMMKLVMKTGRSTKSKNADDSCHKSEFFSLRVRFN
jgi:hypothetical protein